MWFYHQYLVSNVADFPSDQTIAPHLTVDERKSYLSSEIDNIKDLLEDYDDIKWIYEALVQCTVALAQLEKQRFEGSSDLVAWLDKLQELDPQRTGRWHDLRKELSLA